MIRTEKEYKEAVSRCEQNKKIIQKQKKAIEKLNLTPDEIKGALDPILLFHQQLVEEVEWYESVKRGDFKTISSLKAIGCLLIALRIASGLTQKDLSKCLKVTEAQVSRDERNEYHGISLERAEKIINIFGVHLKAEIQFDHPLERKKILAMAGSNLTNKNISVLTA